MDVYDKLRQILDASPTGAPPSKIFDEILRMLFSPEEASLAVHMGLSPRKLSVIAKDAGLPEDEAEKMLEAMADRAVIFSREKDGIRSYSLLPTIPGLFEFPLMKGIVTPEQEKLGKLWDEYHSEALGASFSGRPTPIARVIPVEQSMKADTKVQPYEEIVKLIDSVKYFALARCACRESVKSCDSPREMCLIFEGAGRFLVQRGFAREISREEAHKVLDLAEKSGLVHTVSNSADKPTFICNCCPCCCTILTCSTRLGLPNAFAPSGFEARIDAEACTGCGVCADDRCPKEAIEVIDDKALLSPEKCIGCGLCVSACPAEAIALIRRAEPPQVLPTLNELGIKVLTEKGKIEAYLSQMKG
ncbi:MAG TPA: 4Fe-4S binding protein [Deltaproteobacteria bacterium]|jgi:ferredoxin|nr:4Fe-4S binding protein [Deltaproteobacteria bacterium]